MPTVEVWLTRRHVLPRKSTLMFWRTWNSIFLSSANKYRRSLDTNYIFRKIEKDGSYSRIIVNADHPAQFKYSKNLEILRVTFRYGHFNRLGVPQWHNGKTPEEYQIICENWGWSQAMFYETRISIGQRNQTQFEWYLSFMKARTPETISKQCSYSMLIHWGS